MEIVLYITGSLTNIIRLLRPHQYIKNLFIFTPVFFAGQFLEASIVYNALIGFVGFSITASAIYILNDYKDIEQDRLHPKKKNRPLASGAVNKSLALSLMFFLLAAGIGLMSWVSLQAMGILLLYVVLNLAYSYKLKHVAIFDIAIIATGFVLRLFVGSAVTGIPLSQWIIIMTFLLALFLALAKRRDDMLIYLDTNIKMRKVIEFYNLKFIEGAMMIMASVTIVAYILYTTSPSITSRLQSDSVYLTALYVVLGVMRYLQITFVEEDSGAPAHKISRDPFLIFVVVAWLTHFGVLLYV